MLSNTAVSRLIVPMTFSKNVVATADDISDHSGSVVADPGGGSTQVFGDARIALYLIHAGVRFTNITIPKGASIVSATLTLRQARHPSLTSTPTGTWYAWASDNAAQFSGGNLPSTVTKTSASNSFVAAPNGTKSNVVHTVTSIVQEIVNRAGWVSGNAINFLAIANNVDTSACDIWDDYSTTSAVVPVLNISYR